VTIVDRFNGRVIWGGDAATMAEAVRQALAARADLSGANLSLANLSRANLSGADLSGADLSGADLSGANLWRANLSRAHLSRADLSWADLSRADLSRADLSRADLSGANLSGANLSGANLSRANLSGANLSRANLSGADLSGADLSRADLSGANLSGANYATTTRWPSPGAVLLAEWGTSQHVTALMRYDAANHPLGSAPFDAWAAGGPCPYDGCAFGRAAHFTEDRTAWSPGPAPSALDLVRRLFAEKLVLKEDA
jgi:hypothetical protein